MIAAIVCAIQIEIATLKDPIAAVENSRRLAMIETDETEMMTGRDCTDEEVIPEEALMTYPTVMRNLVEVGVEGLTVILKVLVAEETRRFVAPLDIEPCFKPLLKQLNSMHHKLAQLSNISTYILAWLGLMRARKRSGHCLFNKLRISSYTIPASYYLFKDLHLLLRCRSKPRVI